MNPNIRVGTVAGTGSAINVELGFIPDYVRVWNEDGDAIIEWATGMTDGHGVKTSASVEPISSNGISADPGEPYKDSNNPGRGAGFTIGTDAGVNENGKDIYYVAMRSGAGAA